MVERLLEAKAAVDAKDVNSCGPGATAVTVLRIHRRLRLEERLDHRIRMRSAAACRLGSHARGKAAGKPNGTKGEKNSETMLVPQKSNFGNCGQSISSLDLTNTVVLRCLEVIELAEKAMSTAGAVQMIWYHHPLINLHGPASFCKKNISAGCIQTIMRIIRIPPSSQSMAQQNGTKVVPGSA